MNAAQTRWFFYQQPCGEWRWDAVGTDGGIVAQATSGFPTRTQCVQNARNCGYAGTAEPRRPQIPTYS